MPLPPTAALVRMALQNTPDCVDSMLIAPWPTIPVAKSMSAEEVFSECVEAVWVVPCDMMTV
jgi:hypothetical protein